jgi:hypothetical protein
MKALLACLALLCVSASEPRFTDATQSGIAPWLHPEIVRVDCIAGSGSAFRVGPQTLVSVNHVSSLAGCFAEGRPLNVAYHSGDFSILTGPVADKWLRIDCGGYIAGKEYHALGYARGLGTQTEVDLTATGKTGNGFAILSGVFTVVPGQSGGPIVNDKGAVVGTVNVYDMQSGLSGSIPLSETPLCRG